MKEALENFALKIPDLSSKKPAEMISYFVYFSTVVEGVESVSAAEVLRCFGTLRVPAYSNVPSYLSKHSKRGKAQKFIKGKAGYALTRDGQLEIQKTLHAGPAKLETSFLLRALLLKVMDGAERTFLQEAIDCYEIGARRSAIVMTWLMAIHHLCAHVLAKKLPEFNAVLGKNTDKRVKISCVVAQDDFSEIPEGKLIEFLRSAGVISNDVRKILEEKLGVRNSAAHPSGVVISDVKATDFIIDLVENVIIKY